MASFKLKIGACSSEDRAADSGSGGRRFESYQARQKTIFPLWWAVSSIGRATDS